MGCLVCKRLERVLESWNSECIKARASLYCRVSTKLVAYDNVEMERAKSELEVHRSLCVSYPSGQVHVLTVCGGSR